MIVSNQDCDASTSEIILANFWRMTGWLIRGLPKTIRWFDHLRHSSTTVRFQRVTAQVMAQRSWLKLLIITIKPLCSSPSKFSTGTLTLSNWTKVVAAAEEYEVLIRLVSMFSSRGMRMTENPFSVLQAVTK